MAHREGDSQLGYMPKRDADVRLPRATRVKNKTPASVQITAEQILREARERQLEEVTAPPRQKITDFEELNDYRLRRRKEFEDLLRRVRWNISVWVKYANWEESQKDFERARSVWERALEVEYRNPTLWLKYAEMEMRSKFVNHARNVWDRAVTLLPRIDQLWYKYVHMEEMLGNVSGARRVFERWMNWEPDHHGWAAFIKFELRHNEIENARNLFEKYVCMLPSVKAWIKYAKFEMKNGEIGRARECYERAGEALGEDGQVEELFLAFADFEERCKEYDRARAIYRYALDHIPKGQAEEVYRKLVAFEKQHGDRAGIEDVIIAKKRFDYFEQVKKQPTNYDAWFDYIRLEEEAGDKERVREVYERAVANVPPAEEKRFWKRYIYLWINYALYEELEAKDSERTREVYKACLRIIPHSSFSFSKVWIMAAHFEIRHKQLSDARKILGQALGMAPKEKIFKSYIELELQLGKIDRCRILYERFLSFSPSNCYAWSKYAEMERSLGESERARAIFELAIAQPVLDMPELLWKAYIDFEISEGEYERTRQLYERLLERTKHLKVWLSFAQFEASLPVSDDRREEGGDEGKEGGKGEGRKKVEEEGDKEEELKAQKLRRLERARAIFSRANDHLRSLCLSSSSHSEAPLSASEDSLALSQSSVALSDLKEQRVLLLEAWRDAERKASEEEKLEGGELERVQEMMPQRVKRKRAVTTEDGAPAGFEEYYDYMFPDEKGAAPSLKILEAAYKWKRQKTRHEDEEEEDEEEVGDEEKGEGAGAGEEESSSSDDD